MYILYKRFIIIVESLKCVSYTCNLHFANNKIILQKFILFYLILFYYVLNIYYTDTGCLHGIVENM